MSNDMNIVNKETTENIAETCSGENKGAKDDNKIVPIINKTNPASTAELAAQLVAQYAAQPLAQAVGQSALPTMSPTDSPAFSQTADQVVAYAAAQAAAQAQLAIQAASLSAGQPIAYASVPTAGQSVTEPTDRPIGQASAEPTAQTSGQTMAQPTAQTSGQTMAQPTAQISGQTMDRPGVRPAEDFSSSSSIQDGYTDSSSSSAVQTGYADSPKIDAGSDTSDHMDAGTDEESDEDFGRIGRKHRFFRSEPDDDFALDEEERPKRRFFRFRSASEEESRDKLILSRIKDEDLMEYLALEQRRIEFLQQAKEAKEKRLLIAFQLLISLAAIVAITYLLQDNPTILISILYIVGIVAALNVWKNPHDKGRKH